MAVKARQAIQSMTGFGRAQVQTPQASVVVEARSTNHRFCDVSVRCPEGFGQCEEQIRQRLRQAIRRGRLIINVDVAARDGQLDLDWRRLQQRYRQLMQVKHRFHIQEDIGLAHLVALLELDRSSRRVDPAQAWPSVQAAVARATDQLVASRVREGHALVRALERYAARIDHRLRRIQQRLPVVVRRHTARLKARLHQALGREVDQQLQQQLASLEQELDISEELTRAQAHLVELRRTLQADAEVGKRLEFILQEVMREVNTIGSKANDYGIERAAIDIKTLLEKIREQVQNLE